MFLGKTDLRETDYSRMRAYVLYTQDTCTHKQTTKTTHDNDTAKIHNDDIEVLKHAYHLDRSKSGTTYTMLINKQVS